MNRVTENEIGISKPSFNISNAKLLRGLQERSILWLLIGEVSPQKNLHSIILLFEIVMPFPFSVIHGKKAVTAVYKWLCCWFISFELCLSASVKSTEGFTVHKGSLWFSLELLLPTQTSSIMHCFTLNTSAYFDAWFGVLRALFLLRLLFFNTYNGTVINYASNTNTLLTSDFKFKFFLFWFDFS